jgi:hypothetical protein
MEFVKHLFVAHSAPPRLAALATALLSCTIWANAAKI